jgi:hypothetical protein
MPIRFPDPPSSITEAIRAQRRLPRLLRRLEAGGAEKKAAVLPAQPVFTVGLDELLEAGGGVTAERTVISHPTWRYSRIGADGRPEAVELDERVKEGALGAGDDRFGPMIREALAIADEDPRVKEHDYEARLFRVPALNLLALWLHAMAALDLFVALGRTPGDLEPNRLYDDEEFMSLLHHAAEQQSSHYSSADSPDELGS